MNTKHFLLALLTGLLTGCTAVDDDDDSAPVGPQYPEVVETEWLGDLTGTITYTKDYTSGPLEGTQCVETFSVTGSPLSATPEACTACDQVYQVFVNVVDNCAGGDDLDDEGQAGFDLRQTEEEAVMWWYFEGWFNSEWTELGTGTLAQDFENSRLDFTYEFEDPQNDSVAGNLAWGDGCFPCQYDGNYVMDFDFAFDLPADWDAE